MAPVEDDDKIVGASNDRTKDVRDESRDEEEEGDEAGSNMDEVEIERVEKVYRFV
jgi:hypothetical protein